jgi:hypothetical protein
MFFSEHHTLFVVSLFGMRRKILISVRPTSVYRKVTHTPAPAPVQAHRPYTLHNNLLPQGSLHLVNNFALPLVGTPSANRGVGHQTSGRLQNMVKADGGNLS